MSLGTNQNDARCLSGTAETQTFQQYIQQCRKTQDTTRSLQFFSESKRGYKELFQTLRAQYDDILVTGNSLNALVELAGATTNGANAQLNTLQKRKDVLLAEIKGQKRAGEAADKSFLEDIMHGRQPQPETIPSLQDGVLLLFWFGWILMMITLVVVRFLAPGGGVKSGLFSLVLLVLVTIALFGLLKQVA
jgi:hypothetical protein